MIIEFIITAVIVLAAVFIFYKNLRKKLSGKCDCGSCSSKCPYCKDKAAIHR